MSFYNGTPKFCLGLLLFLLEESRTPVFKILVRSLLPTPLNKPHWLTAQTQEKWFKSIQPYIYSVPIYLYYCYAIFTTQAIGELLLEEILPSFHLEEFYIVNVEDIMKRFKHGIEGTLPVKK